MNNWKPINRVREYGIKTEKVETSEFPNEPKWHFVDNGKECMEVSRKVLCEDGKEAILQGNAHKGKNKAD